MDNCPVMVVDESRAGPLQVMGLNSASDLYEQVIYQPPRAV